MKRQDPGRLSKTIVRYFLDNIVLRNFKIRYTSSYIERTIRRCRNLISLLALMKFNLKLISVLIDTAPILMRVIMLSGTRNQPQCQAVTD